MCKNAGITGYRTNHSLTATAATRLHQSGSVEEQEIIERTGHKSIEAVRSYKRSSHEQLEVSDILNNGNSKKRISYNDTVLEIDIHKSISTSSVSNSPPWSTANLVQLQFSTSHHVHLYSLMIMHRSSSYIAYINIVL